MFNSGAWIAAVAAGIWAVTYAIPVAEQLASVARALAAF